MTGFDDYDRPFDPGFKLEMLSRKALASLGREYMLFQHINDRAVHPIIIGRFGAEADIDVVNDEWMGASPIYNRRVRRLLKIEGDSVASVFKGLQNDVGFPHQFQAVNYEVESETRGTFWLDYCGPFAHIAAASRGNATAIKQLCWDMEDTTFPATTMAVNPKAGCLPIHRPPLPADHTGPVCKWEVTISDRHERVEQRETERIISRSKAACFEYAAPKETSAEGLDDYSGPFLPNYVLEDFSQPALVSLCKEASAGVRPIYAWEIVIDDDAEPRVYPGVQEPFRADVLRSFPLTSREDR